MGRLADDLSIRLTGKSGCKLRDTGSRVRGDGPATMTPRLGGGDIERGAILKICTHKETARSRSRGYVGGMAITVGRNSDPDVAVKPMLLIFTGRRDGSSRRADGFLAHVLQRRCNHERFALRHIHREDRPDLFGRFRVTEIPTLVVIDEKRVRGRLVKPKGSADIQAFLDPWLK